jgi:polyisoprenoid-binding protein YceI
MRHISKISGLLLCVAACGESGTSEQPPPAAAEPTAVAEPVATAKPAEAPAVEADPSEAAPSAVQGEPTADPAANVAQGQAVYAIAAKGEASFLIDAPLEKIKGRWTKFGGQLQVDATDLTKTRGQITMMLSDLVTTTFDDNPGKNAKQTEHAKNWMEVGPDSANKAQHDRTSFTITSIKSATPSSFAKGATAKVTAVGKLSLHGRTVDRTVELDVTAKGPPEAPNSIEIKTRSPMQVSLVAHDIKPRDLAGQFLAGALEKIGQKISDTSRVSIRLTATRK